MFLYSLDTSESSKPTYKMFKMLDVVKFDGEDNLVQVVTYKAQKCW